MSRIRSTDTQPERLVRSVLHRLGFRFRLHQKDLPGSPDIVLPRHRLAVFVHGCFWHRHRGCEFAYSPKSRVAFWRDKFGRNIDRDAHAKQRLKALGWKVIVIWECEARDWPKLVKKMELLFWQAQKAVVNKDS
jgi:DNA mismatch endonuclease, patch repair protein